MEERQKTLFAQRVAELRKERGETQAEFSQRTGVRQQTISGYENGKVSPTLDAVIQIAKACDVSVDWLCGLSDTKRNKFTEYADVIMALVNIGEAIKGKLYLVMEEVEKFGYDDSWVEEEIALRIEDEEIQKFLKSWNDILPLVKSNTISRNLYELWLKDEVKKYRIKTPAAEDEEIFNELFGDDSDDSKSSQAQEPPQSTGETPTPDAEKNGGEEE